LNAGDAVTAMLLSLEALPDARMARPYVPQAEMQMNAAMRSARELYVLGGHKLEVRTASFSSNGKRIVTASFDKTARVWEAETGQPVGEPLRGHTDRVVSASFSPDGKRI